MREVSWTLFKGEQGLDATSENRSSPSSIPNCARLNTRAPHLGCSTSTRVKIPQSTGAPAEYAYRGGSGPDGDGRPLHAAQAMGNAMTAQRWRPASPAAYARAVAAMSAGRRRPATDGEQRALQRLAGQRPRGPDDMGIGADQQVAGRFYFSDIDGLSSEASSTLAAAQENEPQSFFFCPLLFLAVAPTAEPFQPVLAALNEQFGQSRTRALLAEIRTRLANGRITSADELRAAGGVPLGERNYYVPAAVQEHFLGDLDIQGHGDVVAWGRRLNYEVRRLEAGSHQSAQR